MTQLMTDQELQQAIQDAEEAAFSLIRLPKPEVPFSRRERIRREVIVWRQMTAYKIQKAREQGESDLELLHTAIYGIMTSFLEAQANGEMGL